MPILSFKIKKWSEVPKNRQWRSSSLSVGGSNRQWYGLSRQWCCNCQFLAWDGNDSCTTQKTTSSLLASRAHSAKEAPFPTSQSIVVVIFHQNTHGMSWFLKHGHDLLALRLVTSIHDPCLWIYSFLIVFMARLLDFHASCFSILESTFQLDLWEGIQIVVNSSFKRLVSMNPF
jgi:hypothetical protein